MIKPISVGDVIYTYIDWTTTDSLGVKIHINRDTKLKVINVVKNTLGYGSILTVQTDDNKTFRIPSVKCYKEWFDDI